MRRIAASTQRVLALGLSSYRNSSHERAPAESPQRVLQEIFRPQSNSWSESGLDLSVSNHFSVLGTARLDIATDSAAEAHEIEALTAALPTDRGCVLVGGDHSITAPIVAGLARTHGALNIVHIDAHPDTYENFDNNPHSHASPFARILERGHAVSLTQYGIRAATQHLRAQAARYQIAMHEMRNRQHWPRPTPRAPVYVSIDLDGLDPAFAPGVAHPEPGGLTVREVLNLIHSIDARIVGADVVEYNAARDVGGATAQVAAKLVRELAAQMLGHSTS
jgi:agmatinase